MKIIKNSVLWLILLLFSTISFSQNNWSAEFRPGLNFATQDIEEADLDIGFGFEVTVAYRFMPHLAGYVGWGWNQFRAEDSFAGMNTDFEETGYTFGLQFIHPITETSISYMIRAGAIYNHIEIENNNGGISADTGHGFGWQVGLGLEMKLDDNWSLRPELRYRSLSRALEIDTINTDLDLSYIAIGVGISRVF